MCGAASGAVLETFLQDRIPAAAIPAGRIISVALFRRKLKNNPSCKERIILN
jgi:hypothetical protein